MTQQDLNNNKNYNVKEDVKMAINTKDNKRKKDISVERLKDYAKEYLSQGYDKDALRHYLLELGYPENKVKIAFEEVMNMKDKKNQPTYFYAPIIVIALLIVGTIFITFYYGSSNEELEDEETTPVEEQPAEVVDTTDIEDTELQDILADVDTAYTGVDCGFDRDCFVAEAQECNDAVFLQQEETALISYESSEECELTKAVVALDEEEPEEVRLLFEGREMYCAYNIQEFDLTLIDGFLNGIEICEGDLKDAVYELRLAQES